MTVFIVNRPTSGRPDVSTAATWGDLYFINQRYIYADEIDDDHRPPLSHIQSMLRAAERFNPETDHMLIAGDHLQIVLFAAMLGARHDKFSVLRYDRKAEGYIPVMVEPDVCGVQI